MSTRKIIIEIKKIKAQLSAKQQNQFGDIILIHTAGVTLSVFLSVWIAQQAMPANHFSAVVS